MHYGEFIGENAEEQKIHVLILGESHHTNADNGNGKIGIPATYTTESVIRSDYYTNPGGRNFRIFDKIAKSLGTEPNNDNRKEFWEMLYFGNYVDILCQAGSKYVRCIVHENCTKYNDQLFDFVNNNSIDVIFCFSRLVYNHLPTADKYEKIDCGHAGIQSDYISCSEYLPNAEHNKTNVALNKELLLFGMRHPASRCFNSDNYAQNIKRAYNVISDN